MKLTMFLFMMNGKNKIYKKDRPKGSVFSYMNKKGIKHNFFSYATMFYDKTKKVRHDSTHNTNSTFCFYFWFDFIILH